MSALPGPDLGRAGVVWLGLVLAGCRCANDDHEARRSAPSASLGAAAPSVEPPRLLYLPDAAPAPSNTIRQNGQSAYQTLPQGLLGGRCPAEMVDVGGRFCIDRYEVVLVDARSGQRLSPFYHPSLAQTRSSLHFWIEESSKVGPTAARTMPVPLPPEFQLKQQLEPKAQSLAGEIPNGYLSADVAAEACARAGKRLCSEEEWVTACRGEAQTMFPYGNHYQAGACNVFRELHPASALHGDPSAGHLDPRLNLVEENGKPLLRRTGTSGCSSRWGADAIFDMVGNLDEWVDDPKGKFLGGFYSRNTRDGCSSSVSAHPRNYFDYSLGTRCCK